MKVYDLNNNEIDETTEKYYYLHDLFTALGENPWLRHSNYPRP